MTQVVAPTPIESATRDQTCRLRRWSSRFPDRAAEADFAAHRLAESGRSLALAALAVGVVWLAFIPIDVRSSASAVGATLSVTVRAISFALLVGVARALWRRAPWLAGGLGRVVVDGIVVVTACSFLLVTASRTSHSGTLQLSALMFGLTVVLFAPTPLADREVLAACFFGAFVLVALAGSGVESPGLLAANLLVALMCGSICSAHLERSARKSFLLLRRSEELNERLVSEVRSGEALRAVLARQASEDGLTGLLNRRAFFDAAQGLADRLDDVAAPSATLVVDADRFKVVNDTYGHAVGDDVLCQLAEDLRSGLRDGDLIGRLGGEEFCIFLPDTSMTEAVTVAERLRRAISERSGAASDGVAMTVSVGVAERHVAESIESSLHRADTAMYEAKRAGGDRLNCDVPICLSAERRPGHHLACAASGGCARSA